MEYLREVLITFSVPVCNVKAINNKSGTPHNALCSDLTLEIAELCPFTSTKAVHDSPMCGFLKRYYPGMSYFITFFLSCGNQKTTREILSQVLNVIKDM